MARERILKRERRTRWLPRSATARLLVAVPLAAAAVLLVATGSGHRAFRRVQRAVEQGQGAALVGVVRRATRPGAPVDATGLAEVIEGNSALGLTCVAVFDHRRRLIAESGCERSAEELLAAMVRVRPGRVAAAGGGRLYQVDRPEPRPRPGPPPGRREPPRFAPDDPLGRGPGGDDRPRDPRRGPPPPGQGPGMRRDPPPPREPGEPDPRFPPPPDLQPVPRPLLVEFTPVFTESLAATARTNLWVGGAVSLGLLLLAALLARLAAGDEARREEQARNQRLAELGEMSAVLAHEIRNPLASLKGHAQLLAERLREAPREHEKATRLVREVVRLEGLVASLLSFVREPRLERVAADPAAILRRAAEALAPAPVVLDLAAAPASWSLDPERIEEVLVNLLRNADQASPGRVEAAAARRRDELVFTVRDHGPGLAAEVRERLFEPFVTTRTTGTGLGLAVARRIVELHRGRLSADNHPAGGATFEVALPRA